MLRSRAPGAALLFAALAACGPAAETRGGAEAPPPGPSAAAHPKRCGGVAGIACAPDEECVDDPSDACDPQKGGADCGGICKPKNAAIANPPAPTPAPVGDEPSMKPPVASTMDAKLREIGLDPAALPPLNKLDPKQLRDVMNTFTKALGVRCNHCHEKDFRAPTANKKIATHMWNDFTRTLAIDGGALYCDSCHQGHDKVLARRDVQALGAWMQSNYVDKLKRADKKDHGCDTCHGDPFEGKILAAWK